MQQDAGFTLMEMLVIISIISIAAAVAVPGYLSWLPDIRLNSATRNLRADLGLARYYAIRRNGQVAVTFDVPGNRYLIFGDNGDGESSGGIAGNWVLDGQEKLLKAITMNEQVKMIKASFAGGTPRVRFNGRGLPNGFGGSVRLKNTKNMYRGLSLSMLGRVTLKTSRDGGITWVDKE